MVRGCGEIMIALRAFSAPSAFTGGVASGPVVGMSAAMTPTGLAILTSVEDVAVVAADVVLAGGTFAPASLLLLEPASDPKDLMQQPEPGACGLEYSHSSPEQCIGETPGDSKLVGGLEVTTRELEVLASLAKGKSNKMIARELDMREGTVKVHVRSLLKKLNATNRTQLALHAYRAVDTALAVRGGRLTIPADPAADQGSSDTSRSQETESTPAVNPGPWIGTYKGPLDRGVG